jgi:hypothetical protein
MVEHKHVQMSIKYSQIENKTRWQKEYLKVLLKPYETKFKPLLSFPPGKRDTNLGYFKSYPKVVSGRYLLYTERIFVTSFGSISTLLELQGTFGPCLHQYTNMERFDAYQRKKAFGDGATALHEEATHHQNCYCMAGWQLECSEPFFLSIQQAIAEMNTWVDGCCYWCRTEYSIRITDGCITLRAWRDLGGCGSPDNHVWQQHWKCLVFGPGELRDPLRIRTLYGELAVTKGL